MEINNQYLFNMFNFKREVFCYFNVCIFHTIKRCKNIERPWGHSLCTLAYEMHALEDNTGDSTVPKIFRNLLGSLIPWRLTWKKKFVYMYLKVWRIQCLYIYLFWPLIKILNKVTWRFFRRQRTHTNRVFLFFIYFVMGNESNQLGVVLPEYQNRNKKNARNCSQSAKRFVLDIMWILH